MSQFLESFRNNLQSFETIQIYKLFLILDRFSQYYQFMQPQQPIKSSPNSSQVSPPKPTAQQQIKLNIKKKLEQAFSILTKISPTNVEIKSSERIINEQLNYLGIIEVLFELILQYSQQKNQTLVKLVITQIFTYMKKQASESKHDRFMINKKFLEFFITYNDVDQKFKRMLQNQYMKFIYANQNLKIRQDTIIFIQHKFVEVLSTTKQTLKAVEKYNQLLLPIDIFIPPVEIVTQASFNLIKSLLHVLRCLFMGGTLQLQYLRSILPDAFSIIYRMTLELVKKIIIAIKNKQEFIFNQGVEDCARFTDMMLMIFSKLDSGKFRILREKIMHTKQIHRLLLVLLNINSHFQINEFIETILSSTTISKGVPIFDKSKIKAQAIAQVTNLIKSLKFQQNFLPLIIPINDKIKQVSQNILSIKKSSLQMLIEFVKTLIKKKDQKVQQSYPYLSAISGLLWIEIKDSLLLKTEQYLRNHQSKSMSQEQLQMNQQQTQLISSIISFSTKYLGICIQLPFLYSLVSKYQNQVIFNISFPWLISRKEHHKRYEGEDYLFFREDIVNRQNTQNIENSASSLIQGYLDNIDGAVTSILTTCINLITVRLAKNGLVDNNIYGNVNLEAMSNQLIHSWALNFYSLQQQIQASLTLIAIISYLSLNRNDLVLMLQKWIYSHKTFFLQTKNDFRITVQFLIMYTYYVDNFYWNLIKGISQNKYRQFHRQVLKYCCYLMRQNYDYQKNDFIKGMAKESSQILYYQALDCINSSLNDNQLIPALYLNFPLKSQLNIPHYIGAYDNYPYYPPISNQTIKHPNASQKHSQNIQAIQNYDPLNKSSKKVEDQNIKQLKGNMLEFYRKIGLNKIQYIYSKQIIQIIQFLSENLHSRADLKIIQFFIEFLKNYLKGQIQNQESLIDIPIVIRGEISTLLSVKAYSLLVVTNQQKFWDMQLMQEKAMELLHVLHYVSNDPYLIYSLGLEKLWEKQFLWTFDVFDESSDDIDQFLKLTDLVMRSALEHYPSQNKVNVEQLLSRIANVYTKWSFQYIYKFSKFNIVFGILLNLILLKIQPQKLFDFLFLTIKDKFMKGQIKKLKDQQRQQQQQRQYSWQYQSQQYKSQIKNIRKWKQRITQGWKRMKIQQVQIFKEDQDQQSWMQYYFDNVQRLLQQSLYLFLMNVYRNSEYLNTQKNITIMHTFLQYLKHYINSNGMITQMGSHFGKIFTCIICIIQRQYIHTNSLKQYDKFILEFLWNNILCLTKLYKSQLQLRIMAIKLLNLIREIIKRNDENFSLQKVQKMYRLAAFCVFKQKNKGTLDKKVEDRDFDDEDQDQWQNNPITLLNNSTSLYLQDQVLLLKTVSKQLIECPHIKIKQWITKVIQNLPVAIKSFVKNKVIYYQQQSKQIGMRKIIKVKRTVRKASENSNLKKQIQEYNMKKKKTQACDEQPANESQRGVDNVSENSNMKKQTQEYNMKKKKNQMCDEQPVNEGQKGVREASENSNMKRQVQEYNIKKQNNQKCDEQTVNEGQTVVGEVSENSNIKNQIQEKKNYQMCDEQPANEG